MQEPSGQLTAPPLRVLPQDAALAEEWALDPRRSRRRLRGTSRRETPQDGDERTRTDERPSDHR
jgi:hypothetical protein